MHVTVGFISLLLHLIGLEPITVGTEIRHSFQLSYKCLIFMIQQQTKLKISDNSGAKTAKCIKVIGGFKRRKAFIGDIIVVSVQRLRNKLKIRSKVKEGEVLKGLIIRTKAKTKRKDNIMTSFDENSICLVSKDMNPLGTRIIGPIPNKMKKTKYQKFLNISAGLT